MEDPFPLSSINVGVRIHFFVGFRENIIGTHNIPDNTAWLLQRLPPRDEIYPLIVLPLREHPDQFDPFLADVVALEMGEGVATSSYNPIGIEDELNIYNVTLDSDPDHVFHARIMCATPTKMCLNGARYEAIPIDKLTAPIEQWLVLGRQSERPLLTIINPEDVKDDPAHPFNSLTWRPMEATSPMRNLNDLFMPCNPPTLASILHFRDVVAQIRRNCLLHVSPSCRPSFQIEFGRHKEDADEVGTLLALKRLATMLFVGGEDTLRRAFVAPERKSELVMLVESCNLRVQPWNNVTKLIVRQRAALNPDAGTRPPPTRKRCYQNNLLDLGNVKFYLENVAHFNGPPPAKADLQRRLEARTAAEEALHALEGNANATKPYRVCYKDPARIAEYTRRGLNMARVLADDIYLIWRCHTPDLLARMISPYYTEDDGALTNQFKSIFDFTAWCNKERHKIKHKESTFPLAINVNLFAATLDPELLQSQLRVVCAMAHRAVYSDVLYPVYTFGRAHVVNPVKQFVRRTDPIARRIPEGVVQGDEMPAADVPDNAPLDNFGNLDSFDNFDMFPDAGFDAGFGQDAPFQFNADAFAGGDLDAMLAADALVPDLPVDQGNQVGVLPQEVLDAIEAAADNTLEVPEDTPYDSWAGPAEAATGYLVWLGLMGEDITRLDDYTNNGMQSAEDVPDDDGVLRSFEK